MKTLGNGAGRRRGFAIILTALMLVWVIPLVGLVIDVGMMYSIKAKMTAACDAAALSAARSLSAGQTIAEQEAAAKDRAQAYYMANFPSGTMETKSGSVKVTVSETTAKVRKVRVEASAAAPVYFMQWLGTSATFVNSVAEASRRDVNVMLVIDRSGSLETAGACDDLEGAAIPFVNLFSNGRDRVGLITFGGDYRVDYPPSRYFKQAPRLVDEIDKISPGGCRGWTGSAQALWRGYEELIKVSEPGALNVLVFFTDGIPNTLTASWAVNTDPSAGSRCWDWQNNVARGSGAWNPSTQRYVGSIASDGGGRDGIRVHTAPAMPVSGNPDLVTIPFGYGGPDKPVDQDCYYRSGSGDVHRDIAAYPDKDLYGNKTVTGYKPVQVHTTGPFSGLVDTADPESMRNAAINAVDNAADRIRKKELSSSQPVTLYVIGLGGAGAAEHELLKRIANTDDSTSYDHDAPEGMYIFAPTAAQLSLAFQKVAGEVLRLSK